MLIFFWAKFKNSSIFFKNFQFQVFLKRLHKINFGYQFTNTFKKKLFLSPDLSCTIFAYVFYWKNDNPWLYILGKIEKIVGIFFNYFQFQLFWSACTKSILDINLQILKEIFSGFKFKLHNIRICFLLKSSRLYL